PGLAINLNPWTSTTALLRELKSDRRLGAGAHIASWFSVEGVVALSLSTPWLMGSAGGSAGGVISYPGGSTGGVALRSRIATSASRGRPKLALVPAGALLIGASALAMAWLAASLAPGGGSLGPVAFVTSGAGLAITVTLLGLAIAGGLFVVPSFAAVQAWAATDRRARGISAVNVLNSAYMPIGGP